MDDLNVDVLYSQPCSRAFRTMMWGLLCLLPLRRTLASGVEVQILPDALGWLLMTVALGWIVDLDRAARSLRRLAVAGLLLSIPGMAWLRPEDSALRAVYFALWVAGSAVTVLFVWRLCELVARMATEAGRRRLAEAALLRRTLYALSLLLPFISLAVASSGSPPAVQLAGGALVLLTSAFLITLMMALMGDMARLCAAGPPEPDPGAADAPSDQAQA